MRATCIAVFIALLACSYSHAASNEYTAVTVEADGQLSLHAADGGTYYAPRVRGHLEGAEEQAGFQQPLIAPDRRTVGWLALFPNCCTSYPIPLELILFRDGAVVQRIVGTGLPIWAWKFVSGSSQVAITQRPVHGTAADHYELRDVASGRLLEKYDHEEGAAEKEIPDWARGLDRNS